MEFLTNLLNSVLGLILTLLPNSPFKAFISAMHENIFLQYAAYFLPMQQIIAVSEAWLLAITTFYVWMVVLRWVQAIE